MTVEQRRDDSNDQFPVGMRVLAVDDDPICLRLLETLLRKCQYHVTTTSQAITALEMLRENRNKFDLVISDVHMPDMDGFKLLELVGLEMDLPVIMLSANGDTKQVMKGITHGACDYLVKPVRMEELKNIWQHVVRRKKVDSRERNSSSQERNNSDRNGTGSGYSDSDAKLGKKRKDQYSDDDEEQDENEHENDDPSAQKKPRVVWSVELHRKFVAAVNQLGLDKAVPKKILELMNVEKLTRENVASHLQKYRLYLKRISSVANQQANMVAALGGPDSPYLRMNSVNFHNFNGSAQFQNNAFRSIPPVGVLGRLNTPASLGLNGLPPPGLAQLSQSANTKFQPNLLPNDHPGSILQGMPTSLEFDQLQPSNDNNSRIFPVLGNSLLGLPNSSLTMQGRSHERQNHTTFGVNSDSTRNSVDPSRCSNSNWATTVPSQPNAINSMDNMVQNISVNISLQSRLQDSQCQAGLMSDNVGPNMGYAPKQTWDDPKLDLLNQSDFLDRSMNSSMGPGAGPVLHRNTGFGSTGQPRFDSFATEHNSHMKQGQIMEHGRPLSYAGDGAGSLEDVVTAMFKREQDENIEEWRFGM